MKINKQLQKSVSKRLKEMKVSDSVALQFPISSKCNVKTTIWRIKNAKLTKSNLYTTKTDEASIFVWRLK